MQIMSVFTSELRGAVSCYVIMAGLKCLVLPRVYVNCVYSNESRVQISNVINVMIFTESEEGA